MWHRWWLEEPGFEPWSIWLQEFPLAYVHPLGSLSWSSRSRLDVSGLCMWSLSPSLPHTVSCFLDSSCDVQLVFLLCGSWWVLIKWWFSFGVGENFHCFLNHLTRHMGSSNCGLQNLWSMEEPVRSVSVGIKADAWAGGVSWEALEYRLVGCTPPMMWSGSLEVLCFPSGHSCHWKRWEVQAGDAAGCTVQRELQPGQPEGGSEEAGGQRWGECGHRHGGRRCLPGVS